MNFRRILSKSSLKSSSSATGKSAINSDEASRLQGEIELLRQTVESLKVSVESRDAAIGTLAREKEKIYVELKSVQRTNRNLHQQLMDERDMHSKEKDYLIEEIKRLSKSEAHDELYRRHDTNNDVNTNFSIKNELKAKDEVIYNICKKYLKIKSSKQSLHQKIKKLQLKSQKMCENVIILLQQNRLSLDNLLDKIVNASITPPTSKQYLRLLKMNSTLHYENTQLKVRLSLKKLFEGNVEDIPDKDRKSDEMLHVVKVKSNGKIRHQEPQYKFCRKRKHKTNFSNLHSKCCPHFRRKKLYHSDPCLAGCY